MDELVAEGALPNLARLARDGGYGRLGTTWPAQTPVAWSTFATGTNPGGHGIFDFIRRDPDRYLPDLALHRYEQRSVFLPPRVVNLRRGTPVWERLSAAGIPSTVLRCPCTYPPDKHRGRMLSGMGVPDIRGGVGTSTFYTTAADARAREHERVIRLEGSPDGPIRTHLVGPRNPKTGEDVLVEIAIGPDLAGRRVTVASGGEPARLEVREGAWSDWLEVDFRLGMLQTMRGMVRFHLVRLDPALELYASPVNFVPGRPVFPISDPWDYAGELKRRIGTYYTAGIVEDHTGLNNGRFDEAAFLDQCDDVMREREAMLHHELDRDDPGLLFCLFDTPDRIQHMFWRFLDPDHPAHGPPGSGDPSADDGGRTGGGAGDLASAGNPEPWLGDVIRDHYRACDAVVGRVLERVDDRTLVVVLSDHGFGGFRRGVHLNTLLHDHGFLALEPGRSPGSGTGDFLEGVDWDRTRAYALGLGGIYLNLRGREANGIVDPGEADALKARISSCLTGLVDPEGKGAVAIPRVRAREVLYRGPFVEEAPDLVVAFSDGYRVSWGTALGGVPAGHFEDNRRKWSGDHIVDPELVPGVLLMNRPFAAEGASLLDLAPTILEALGAPARVETGVDGKAETAAGAEGEGAGDLEGRSLLS